MYTECVEYLRHTSKRKTFRWIQNARMHLFVVSLFFRCYFYSGIFILLPERRANANENIRNTQTPLFDLKCMLNEIGAWTDAGGEMAIENKKSLCSFSLSFTQAQCVCRAQLRISGVWYGIKLKWTTWKSSTRQISTERIDVRLAALQRLRIMFCKLLIGSIFFRFENSKLSAHCQHSWSRQRSSSATSRL